MESVCPSRGVREPFSYKSFQLALFVPEDGITPRPCEITPMNVAAVKIVIIHAPLTPNDRTPQAL